MGRSISIKILSIVLALGVGVTGCLAYYLADNQHDATHRASEKLVIDTDAGGDDAMAILLALSAWKSNHSNFEVIGITCVYGNTYEKNVETNVLKTLTVANAAEIPVYGGSQKPLISSNFTAGNYFGEDGFGDFPFEEKITAKVDSKHAAIALVDLAREHKGELNILVLGPLTNIAVALALDPNFLRNVKRLYVMGGSVAGMGNKSPGVEYNFGHDPESNFVTFNSTESIVLYPWEAVRSTAISREWRRKILGVLPSKFMKFMNKVEEKILDEVFWKPADVMAAAVMIWPHIAKENCSTRVTPITDGAARGGVLVNYDDIPENINTKIILEIDVEMFKQLLLHHFSEKSPQQRQK
ncbi:inosine-uridine preferring nucleoside hydrolase [Diachasma alloeum]|uniref:inosine-uridine preferring nucleoside hydrolase n=1 Tax=Diachasma alloeum TaxID=454923 RepID=UPI00073848CB|nr:inosine-uridine preferring nucleoside hydrolase [Diachasma alloeum]XP_015123118.1 inosine-uridine preferring nucleoside hydrolase [Diachasma alloeum]